MKEPIKCAAAGATMLGIYLVAISLISFLIGLVL
tara:strand:- start:398 stop:499 length:102 start_codon:yes stop_codon:yes gene_type:complete